MGSGAGRGDGIKNPFFNREPPRGETPGRVYALFDQRSDESVYLDCVNADWFDSLDSEGSFSWWSEVADRAPLHVLELPSSSPLGLSMFSPSLASRSKGDEPDGDDDSGDRSWIQVTLNPGGGGDARIYHGLFGEPESIGIDYVAEAPTETARRLSRTFDLSTKTAPLAQIQNVLASVPSPIEWVGVYDVGQGSANGLCDEEAFPLVYFDVGGGVLANKSSFSSNFLDFCYTRSPIVVLSHWDWDHWSSAARFPQCQSLTWIVPNQVLGAVHATMAAAIATHGSLLVWPAGLGGVQAGQITVEQCTGLSGRNHTGLAMLVDGPNGELPILLTGDARYSAIPSGFADVMSIVAAHHGADMRSKATPTCSGDPAARVAYSYGGGNTFGHPRTCTYDRHQANGWPHSNTHPVGAVDRHTTHLRPALGNIALGWSATTPPPCQACSGRFCSLQIAQS